MNSTPYEKGYQKGFALGLLLSYPVSLKLCLEDKFGKLSDQTLQRIDLLSADELETMFKRVVRANSLQELGLLD
ncbi:hypothetical protein BH10PLA2_BH10PLA2_09800 [soil metagenome]